MTKRRARQSLKASSIRRTTQCRELKMPRMLGPFLLNNALAQSYEVALTYKGTVRTVRGLFITCSKSGKVTKNPQFGGIQGYARLSIIYTARNVSFTVILWLPTKTPNCVSSRDSTSRHVEKVLKHPQSISPDCRRCSSRPVGGVPP